MNIYIYENSRRRNWNFLGNIKRLEIPAGKAKPPTVEDGSLLIVHDTDWKKGSSGWSYKEIQNKDEIYVLVISGSPRGGIGDRTSNNERYHCYKRSLNVNLDREGEFKKALIKFIEKIENDQEFSRNPDWKMLYPKKKDYLLSQYILCQGYLAAHGEIKLPVNIIITQDKKIETMKKAWWITALGIDYKEEIERELVSLGYDEHAYTNVMKLCEAIKSNDIEINMVREALKELKIVISGSKNDEK